MANLGFSLRSALGLLPKTEKIESAKKALQDEFEKLTKYAESEELQEYIQLKELVNSDGFKNNKNQINSLDYKKTEEFQKETRFLKLKKNKSIVNYYKVLKSDQLAAFTTTNESEDLKTYLELKAYLSGNEYKEAKSNLESKLKTEQNKIKELNSLSKKSSIKSYFKTLKSSKFDHYQKLKVEAELLDAAQLTENKRFKRYLAFEKSSTFAQFNQVKESEELKYYEGLKAYINSPDYKEAIASFTYANSDEFKKEQQLIELKKNTQIIHWEKYQKSKPYKLYKEVENSDLLKEFETLDELVNSDKFKEYKEYMLDKAKWQKTNEFNDETRYAELEKSADIKWYFTIKNSNKFDELKAWNLTFEDDFTAGKVDDEKWMNSFFWGKMMLNDRYVMADDKQFYTDNKNIELNGTTLKIVTKKEKTEGRVWHPKHGFFKQNFEYTSGMLCSAHSFRQKFGRIEAKIKLNADYPIYQAFWLKGEKILPSVDVFRFNMDKKNRFQVSTFWGDPLKAKEAKKKTERLNGSNFTKDYFIYTLDWEENKLTWKINGIEVSSTTEGVPNEPLYLMLSSGIQKEPTQELQNNTFEIDWVRCYEKA